MVNAWRNFKNIFPRPLFTINFRPEMLKFHPCSILTRKTRVELVIYCVLRACNHFSPLQKPLQAKEFLRLIQNPFGIIRVLPRSSIIHKPVTGQVLIFAIWYKRPVQKKKMKSSQLSILHLINSIVFLTKMKVNDIHKWQTKF